MLSLAPTPLVHSWEFVWFVWANCSFEQILCVNQLTKNELFINLNCLYDPVVEEDSNCGLIITQSIAHEWHGPFYDNYVMLLYIFLKIESSSPCLLQLHGKAQSAHSWIFFILILCSTEVRHMGLERCLEWCVNDFEISFLGELYLFICLLPHVFYQSCFFQSLFLS